MPAPGGYADNNEQPIAQRILTDAWDVCDRAV
jgi:hypothetical protein